MPGRRDRAILLKEHGQDSAALQRLLRRSYPLATVRAREPSGGRSQVWYVYRDGTWTCD